MNEKRSSAWIYDLLLLLVIAGGLYFRSIGLNWDENQHLHPDERFLTMVETALEPVHSMSEYFDTAHSTLNPHNRGYGFFVYGDLPIILVRYAAESLHQTGYDEVNLVGRQLSALADLLTIVLLYFIVSRLYNRKIGTLAAAFSALAVLQIQQSHFFTVDTFANFFIFLTTYFAVLILMKEDGTNSPPRDSVSLLHSPFLWLSVGFGISLGMAVASKLNAAPLAILLPAAFAIRPFLKKDSPPSPEYWTRVLLFLIAGAAASILSFRVFQPYAFSGPGFFGVKPNSAWVDNIKEQRAQASGDADVPFALQWARRSHLFSFKNLTVWGLGLPLGILAWIGFLWMGWRILKGAWKHLLLWGWTALYFLWQSFQFNPTMRYQLPIYPLLAMMAAWVVFEMAKTPRARLWKGVAFFLGGGVLLASAAWAFAFTRIYTRPHTRVAASRWIYENIPAALNVKVIDENHITYRAPISFSNDASVVAGIPYGGQFVAPHDGRLLEFYSPHIMDKQPSGEQTLTIYLSDSPDFSEDDAHIAAILTRDFSHYNGVGGAFPSGRMPELKAGETYYFRITTTGGEIHFLGAAPINETSWDDGLPLRIDGYDGFGGLYQGGLNFEMYWDDNEEKLARFLETLDKGDAIFISSNRQWATTTRVPERYPLTTEYYRALIGCPSAEQVIWCYNVAKPGMFQGELGYDLVAVFESYPTLNIPGIGSFEVNDQFAEEAFTVYDHPKVLIFHKTSAYSRERAKEILGAVDLSHVVHLTPRRAGDYKTLMLPPERWEKLQEYGTWSSLFDTRSLLNRFPVLGLVVWYLFLFVLGAAVYPIVRIFFPGLADKGYLLSRAMGMLLLSYVPWLLGSLGIPNTRVLLAAVFSGILVAGGALAWIQRGELKEEWAAHKRDFLAAEGLFLAFFLFDFLIRLGNPDLWHPAKGGERPMDFSYFNAILKSATFPPYDPWFAGGYINYYYFGFVFVGMPVKLLGIVPSIAYNFILPTLFAMVGTGAFSIAWSLLRGMKKRMSRALAAFSASAGMILLGNLGTVRMLYQGLQRIVHPDAREVEGQIFLHLWWAIQGLTHLFLGEMLPIGRGDWYWFPSRIIPAPGDVEPITEFPLFTFLYSDLHAHMMALPLAMLGIAWAVSFLSARRRGELTAPRLLAELAAGGLILGALRPANTWDLYTYLPLALLTAGYALWRYADGRKIFPMLSELPARVVLTAGGMAALAVFALIFYQPYTHWFGQAYGEVSRWRGPVTPLSSYLAHWGFFLFLIVSWMWQETYDWMAATPLSVGMRFWKKHEGQIALGVLLFLSLLVGMATQKVRVGWVALPIAAWAGVLFFRKDLPDAKRFVLFMTGTAMALTVLVEFVVLVGDIGRMNTVFKLYLQAWTLLALSAGASLGWLLNAIPAWTPSWRKVWQVAAGALFVGAALFTLTATADKIKDRMVPSAPHSLDSMTYMKYAHYSDQGMDMDLSEDYRAIRWMQENVEGSPVIVEANTPEYRWGTRFTIYTGLPGVVGWNWHQRQQRAETLLNVVQERVDEVGEFYETTDIEEAKAFLQRYGVRYIVVGQLEHAYYSEAGLAKFEAYDGTLWREVYRDGNTAIYEVVK
jgi:YYY domain-containing protein